MSALPKPSPFALGLLVLVLLQVACIAYFMGTGAGFGLFNPDAFSYHIHWSKISGSFNPFSDPVLFDPEHDVYRLPFSFPHLILGVTTRLMGPVPAYLLWSVIGVALAYIAAFYFARALGFTGRQAAMAALVHYTFFHVLSQLPPLSLNQLHYLVGAFQFSPESVLHTGPRQYPHDIFFYPLLYGALALTLAGVKAIRSGQDIPRAGLVAWTLLCLLMPFNYLYHWFQFGLAVAILLAVGLLFTWWKVTDFLGRYRTVGLAGLLVISAWAAIVLFQNAQLSGETGYRFALMGGLTEARFVLAPAGLVVRIVLWFAVLLWILRGRTEAVLLAGFLMGCLILMNMQWVTGKNIQPGHWSFGVDRMVAWGIILLVYQAATHWNVRWLPIARRAVIAVSLCFLVGSSAVSWRNFANLSRWDAERSELVEHLNTLPASVLLVPEIWLETDVLIHTHHYGFLPRGAQSAVSADEFWRRLAYAGTALGYSREGFDTWIHTRSVRFFGMLYGTQKEFSSSYYFDPARREGVLRFNEGGLPPWDEVSLTGALGSGLGGLRKPDFAVLHTDESLPDGASVVFSNRLYTVIRLREEAVGWGVLQPISERKYPLTR